MAEMAANRATQPVTQIANVDIARGLRCILNASGTLDLAPIGQRGDYVAAVDLKAGQPGMVYPIGAAGLVAAVASVLTNVGDDAFSAANGQFSNVSAGAAYMGRWVLGASGAGVLGEVEISAVK